MKAVLESFSGSKEARRVGDKRLSPLLLVIVLSAAVAAAVPGGALQTQEAVNVKNRSSAQRERLEQAAGLTWHMARKDLSSFPMPMASKRGWHSAYLSLIHI